MRIFLFCAMLGLVAITLTVEYTSAQDDSASSTGAGARDARSTKSKRSRPNRLAVADKTNPKRLREGTVISDATGHFREDGDGASFVASGGLEFGTLPNLNLERVVRLLKGADEPSSIRWSVTGTVTEFNGRNYILLKRAVYKSASPPPVPDRVAP